MKKYRSKILRFPSLSWWWPIIILVMMLVSVNAQVFFAGRTLIPITSAHGVVPDVPYGYVGPKPDWTTTLDPYAAFSCNYAYDAFSAESLLEGRIPFWNSYQGLEQPFLSNYFSSVLYPPNWLRILISPAWWDMVYLINWLLAGAFIYGYLRLLGLEKGPSLIGSALVFSNGYFQFILALREVPAVAAWWPLLLYGVERTIQDPEWRDRHWLLALGVYCSITGGQPEVTFMSLFVVLVYALVRLATWPRSAWQGFIALAPGSLAGLLIAAPQWINFATYAFTNFTHHQPGHQVGLYHFNFKTLISYFFPFFYGRLHFMPYGTIENWNWDLSPGWFPVIGVFLAFFSLSTLIKKPQWGLGFLWITATVMIAKIWGVPGVNLIGKLPLFESIFFPKFTGFLIVFALSGLAAYGVFSLSRSDAREWTPWVLSWFAFVIAIFAMGFFPIWPVLSKGDFLNGPWRTLAAFGGLGLAWAVIGPLGLWWIKWRRSNEHDLLYSLAAFGILLQGAAYACNGYSFQTYWVLSSCSLVIFVLLILVTGFVRKIHMCRLYVILQLVLVALPALFTAFFASYGLPVRYNPLTPAPYLDILRKLQNDNLYRAYSVDRVPHPNFAVPFRLANLSSLEAILPSGSAAFMRSYLDRGVSPLWFGGNAAAGRNPKFTAIDEFFNNKRYFDMVGVRYLVTKNVKKQTVLYERSGSRVPLNLDRPLQATFLCPTDVLTEIEVYLSTHKRKNPGTVTLSLYKLDGTTLGSSTVSAAGLSDNSFQKFGFTPVHGLKDQRLRLQLEFQSEQRKSMIAAWIFPGHQDQGFLFRIVDSSSIPSFPGPVLYERKGPRVPVPIRAPLKANFTCPADSLKKIGVFLSTYRRKNNGKVILKVFGPDGTLLGSDGLPSAILEDNRFAQFVFDPINGFKGQQLRLQLEFHPEKQGSMIAGWKFPKHPDWGFVFRITDPTKVLPLIYSDKNACIWENREANSRVFLAPEAGVVSSWKEALNRLKDTPDLTRKVWLDQGEALKTDWPMGKAPGKLVSFRMENNDIWIQYRADTAGILADMGSYMDGWRADVNGQEVPVLRVNGAFRGVRIEAPGTYTIRFRYRPVYWNLTVVLAFLGILVVVSGTLLNIGKRRQGVP